MSEWVRSIIYLGNFGVGILFASHIACMKLGSRDKKTTFGRIEDAISGFLCKISEKMGIPEEKTKDFTAITIFFAILCLVVAVTA